MTTRSNLFPEDTLPRERELIASLVDSMLEKLRVNRHKPGFETLTAGFCLHRALEEWEELISEWDRTDDFSKESVIREAADVANFLAMFIFVLKRRKK